MTEPHRLDCPDAQAIQGLWRLVSRVNRGQCLPDPATHYLFREGKLKEIVPDLVDSGKVRATYQLDEQANPKQIVLAHDFNGPDGPPDPKPFVERGFYILDGDRLELCWGGPPGKFPSEFSAKTQIVLTLQRDRGPIPETRQPSRRPPIKDKRLGSVVWDDNVNLYCGERTQAGQRIEFHLELDEDDTVTAALARAQQVFSKFEHYAGVAKEYAAKMLLDLKNDSWLDDDAEPLGPDEFKTRMTLQSLVFSPDGTVTFYHNDGDLFWGHSIEIRMDVSDQFVHADIRG